MCDFHSICVRSDGAIAHIPTNSHSEAVDALKWRENQALREPFFLEVEGTTATPEIRGGEPNEVQQKVIARHYGALALVLAEPLKHRDMLMGAGIFSGSEYLDIRVKAAEKTGCPLLGGLAINVINRFGGESYQAVESLVPLIAECSNDPKMIRRRIYLFLDWQIRSLIPEVCELLNFNDEAARLRAINQVTDSSTAELARREVESVRAILWRKSLALDPRALDLDLARALDLALARSKLLVMYVEFIGKAALLK